MTEPFKWQVVDDGISLEAARRILKSRTSEGSPWAGYEFRIEPSDFHLDGSFQIESRKLSSAEDHQVRA